MPTYQIEHPDGHVYSVDSPSELNQDQIMQAVSQYKPEATFAQKASPYVRNAAQTVGLMGGAAVGTAAGLPFGGPVGAAVAGPVGAGLGYAGGNRIADLYDQAVGLGKPQTGKQVLWNTVADPLRGASYEMLGQSIPAGIKAVKPFIGNQRGATLLNEMAQKEAANKIAEYAPPGSSQTLFKQATAENQAIPINQTQEAAQEIIDSISKRSPEAQKQAGVALKWAQGLLDDAQGGSAFTPDKVNQELIGLGQSLKSAELKPVRGQLSQLYKALNDDLAAAADVPGASTLQAARATWMREKAVDELGEYIDAAMKTKRGLGGAEQFNPNQVIEKLKSSPWFSEAFSSVEQKEIRSLLQNLNNIPVLPAPGSQSIGSGRIMAKLARMGAAGLGAGAYTGSPITGAVVGGATGAIEQAATTGNMIAQAMKMQVGRDFLRQMLEQGQGSISAKGLSLLSMVTQNNYKNILPSISNSLSGIGNLIYPQRPQQPAPSMNIQAQEGR